MDDERWEWFGAFGLHWPGVGGHQGLVASGTGDRHVVDFSWGVLFGEIVNC